jgi:ElaB/YqjD/DUF883 family membrane-anchored ribosome-binding protein
MTQSGEYNSAVFEKFLKYMQANPYKTEDQYFTIYSEYAKMLFRHYHPRASPRELFEVQNNAKRALKKEKDEFEDLVKKYEKEFDDRVKKADELKRQLILTHMKEAARAASMTLVDIKSDYGSDKSEEFELVEKTD